MANDLIFEPDKGTSFRESVMNLQRELLKTGSPYRMILFNGIHITVSYYSNIDDICLIYHLKCEINRLKNLQVK